MAINEKLKDLFKEEKETEKAEKKDSNLKDNISKSLDDIINQVKKSVENLTNSASQQVSEIKNKVEEKKEAIVSKKSQTPPPPPSAKPLEKVLNEKKTPEAKLEINQTPVPEVQGQQDLSSSDIKKLIKIQRKQIQDLKNALTIQKDQTLKLEAKIAKRDELLAKYSEEINKFKDNYTKMAKQNEAYALRQLNSDKEVETRFNKAFKEKDELIKSLQKDLETSAETVKKEALKEIDKVKELFKKELEAKDKLIQGAKQLAEKGADEFSQAFKLQIETLIKDKDSLTKELEKAKGLISETKIRFNEEMKEIELFKERIVKDSEEKLKFASIKLIEKILGGLENLDKIVNIPQEDPKLKDYLLGFKMINESLFQILKGDGVIEIDTNIPFDPNLHEAREKEFTEGVEENKIVLVFQKGYTYKGRLIRPAVVKINSK